MFLITSGSQAAVSIPERSLKARLGSLVLNEMIRRGENGFEVKNKGDREEV